MKKLMAIALTAAMSLGLLAGCGSSSSAASEAPASSAASSAVSEAPASSAVSSAVSSAADEAAASSTADTAESVLEYVKANGKLVVGITDFEPMDYKDESGNWIGFDADMAKAFA